MTDPVEGRNEQGKFTSGNRFWQHGELGRPRKFEGPEELWAACLEYFQWVEENPLIEVKPMNVGGAVVMVEIPKMRAMTVHALCNFLGIHSSAWHRWRDEREDLKDVIAAVDQIMYDQKFTGAAAEMLNPSIISRDLGLADKTDLTSSDGSFNNRTDQEILAEIAAIQKNLGIK